MMRGGPSAPRPPLTSTAPATQSRPQGSRVAQALVALALWAIILPSCVDFSDLIAVATNSVNLSSMQANPVTRTLKFAILLISVVFLAQNFVKARALLARINIYFLLFTALMFISMLWSADPGATLARSVSFLAPLLLALAFCIVGWRPARLQEVVRPILTLVMISSLIYILMDPADAIDFDKAGYHGVSGQKNPFGEACAISTLLWMHAWISGSARTWKAYVFAPISWACLWLSHSATSLLATVFATFLMLMLLRTPPGLRRYMRYIVIAFAGLIVAYALAILHLVPGLSTILLGPITAITGKDMTFTNRTAIWELIQDHARLHPWLGTGFGAYWTSPTPDSPSFVVLAKLYFWPSESHNGYLEIYNDFGFLGLVLLVGFLAVFVRQALRLFRTDPRQGTLYLAIFFQQAFTNLSESCWFSANGILPVIFVTMTTCALGRGLLDQQTTPARPAGPIAPPKQPQTMSLRGQQRRVFR